MLFTIMFMVSGATIFVTRYVYAHRNEKETSNKSEYNIKRLSGYKFIQPLLSAKPSSESEEYIEVKRSVEDLIQEYKDKGVLEAASVYLRDFDQGNWFHAYDTGRYLPGSILKISVLMTYLKMDEENPGVLERKITYEKNYITKAVQNIVTKGIEFGKTYTIRQLLEYMIEYSDNKASLILNENMDVNILKKIFTDLNIKPPEKDAVIYELSARECSRFMEVLFNATYLNNKNSEYAMTLLTKSHFSDGIVKGVPESDLLIAHKFGESGNIINRQLHETAVLYLKNKPYLITIMTLGKNNVDLSSLAEVLQGISNRIYHKIVNN